MISQDALKSVNANIVRVAYFCFSLSRYDNNDIMTGVINEPGAVILSSVSLLGFKSVRVVRI